MIRYGILSTSSIAPRFISAVRAAGDAQIVALSSRSVEKAREKAALWDIPTAYGSHKELLEDPNVDVVYISTVNAQHYTWAKAALEHGKHVVCEKPCTVSSALTRELFALAQQKRLFLMEAQKMLFLPAILETRKFISAGLLGDIHMVEMSHSFSAAYNNWMYDAQAGGGPLLSSGIYAVEFLLWMFGPIRSIKGTASFMPNGVEYQYILTGETENGILFSIRNSTKTALDNTAKIYGANGFLEIPEYWKARKINLQLSNQETQIYEFPCEYELVYEAEHISRCVETGALTSPVVTPELTIAGIEALEQVKENW